MRKFQGQTSAQTAILAVTIGALLSGCAADLKFPTPRANSVSGEAALEYSASQLLAGTHIEFQSPDFYTLPSPTVVGYAGDVKNYYYPISFSTPAPQKLPASVEDPSVTMRPAFVRNASVDLTNANSKMTTNQAYSGSYGDLSTAPPCSECATFDSSTNGSYYRSQSTESDITYVPIAVSSPIPYVIESPIPHADQILKCQPYNSSCVFQLPAAANAIPGRAYTFLRTTNGTVDPTTNYFMIQSQVQESIDNVTGTALTPAYLYLSQAGNTVSLLSDGVSKWITIARQLPAVGYNTDHYTLFDRACIQSGPINSTDDSVNKLLAGGFYLDLDRTALGSTENLILQITFLPLGPGNVGPDFINATAMGLTPADLGSIPDQSFALTPADTAVIQVHLARTAQVRTTLMQQLQPRYLLYSDTDHYTQIGQKIAEFSAPTGQIRQEQVLIPLSVDSTADRIHVQRYSGSVIFLDASLIRLGVPTHE